MCSGVCSEQTVLKNIFICKQFEIQTNWMVFNLSLFWTFCFWGMGKVCFVRMDFYMKKGVKVVQCLVLT